MSGEVIEQGNHDYLMGLKGHYHSLVTTQVGINLIIQFFKTFIQNSIIIGKFKLFSK